jgi:predicted nucleic acid-binding protein
LIFVDTNVFMYAVGREHPLKREARAALMNPRERGETLATSAEVLQELLHAYLPVNRIEDLDAALRLAGDLTVIWPVAHEDVVSARTLVARHPGLAARDLLHLALCRRYGATAVISYDRALVAAFGRPSRP